MNSNYGPVWEHLGVAYQKQGRNRDAVSVLEKANLLLPSSSLAWRHLAEAYQATGRSADAQRAAARAQQLGSAAPKANKKRRNGSPRPAASDTDALQIRDIRAIRGSY